MQLGYKNIATFPRSPSTAAAVGIDLGAAGRAASLCKALGAEMGKNQAFLQILKFPSNFFTLQHFVIKRCVQNLVFAERFFCI